MSPRFRSRFIRDVLDVLERSDVSVASRLAAKLSPRLMRLLSEQVYRATDVHSTMRLEEAEDALLGIDAALGDGGGKVLESAGFMLGSRLLSTRGGVAVPGDLIRTISRLRTPVELPFEGVEVVFELEENPHGFQLRLGAIGNPRSTRIMSYLVVGYVKAAHTFGEQRNAGDLRLNADVMGDRAVVTAMFRRVAAPLPSDPTAALSKRSASRSRFPAAGSLSAEVDRILERTSLPPTRRSSSSFPAVRMPSDTPQGEPRDALPYAPTQPSMPSPYPRVRSDDTSGIQRAGRRDEREEQDSSPPPPVTDSPSRATSGPREAWRRSTREGGGSSEGGSGTRGSVEPPADPNKRSGYNIRRGLPLTGTEESEASPTPPRPSWRHRR
ncbi:MAG: hypothetical protein KIT72_03470 [Polyangiaceae bacterium]|nr:hypothetical protein [Polyangiaceae bacterium]MCW5789460.1 hypothetical protein [Polyangiaceae bacterium]